MQRKSSGFPGQVRGDTSMSSPKGNLVAWAWLWAVVPWLLGEHSGHQQGWLRLKVNMGSHNLPPKLNSA